MSSTIVLLIFLRPLKVVEYNGETMGTTFHIKWISQADQDEIKKIQVQINEALKDINTKMSTYIPSSELSRFNKTPAHKWFSLSSDTAEVLFEAFNISQFTQGAFDPTVGPLIEAWGFGSEGSRIKALPSERVEALLKITGIEKIELRASPAAIKKHQAAVTIDLSAIAKGYAVDRVADILNTNDIDNFMVEIGGEVLAEGSHLNGRPWRIAVEKPSFFPDTSQTQRVLTVTDTAIATSGTYRNYFDDQGRQYSHILSPVTGMPVKHNTVSVTVCHPSCMTADAWATALLVLGAEKGLSLAEKKDLAVQFLTQENGKIIERTSNAFDLRFK